MCLQKVYLLVEHYWAYALLRTSDRTLFKNMTKTKIELLRYKNQKSDAKMN